MKPSSRIFAIAQKEWRLNTRYMTEYLAANLISPIKTAILMYFIYAGFLVKGNANLGVVDKGNFSLFVLLGTTCHGIMLGSVYIFRSKMVTEKWWQTVTATLISPVRTLEVVFGYIVGSGAIQLAIGGLFFAAIAIIHQVSLSIFLIAFFTLILLGIFAFGLGLVGATIALSWEGKSFYFDYAIQGLTFLSCFYYPIQTLPDVIHPLIQTLPTYHAAQLIQNLYTFGTAPNAAFTLCYLGAVATLSLCLPALFFERSLKRHGIVGY